MANSSVSKQHPRFQDLSGKLFGKLTAQSHEFRVSTSGRRRTFWQCKCDCGNIVSVVADSLTGGNTQSCGCWQRVRASQSNVTHGQSSQSEYAVWLTMKARCCRKSSAKFANYGGRGITVCERWMDFRNFIADMGRRPSSQHTIERIDSNGNYEPGNCRWATQHDQQNNRRNNRLLTLNGETKTVAQWSASLGIPILRIRRRLARGMSVEQVLCVDDFRRK